MAKFTKKAIIDTFVELLNKKPLSQITVKEITDICEINHNTFYYYFDDIYAIIDELFNSELLKLYETTNSSASLSDACNYALELVTTKKKAIRNIYNSVSRDRLQNYLMKTIDKLMNEFVGAMLKGSDIDEDDKKFFIEYHKYAMLGFVITWLENGKDDELEYMLSRFSHLTETSIRDYVKSAAKTFGQ